MSANQDSYFGIAEEVTWGTAVAPARYYEIQSEDVSGSYDRIESEGFRAGQKVARKDRFEINPKGATGNVTVEGIDMSIGLIFKHALGVVASGAPAGGYTAHTFTLGDLKGKGLTHQFGRVDASGNLQVFTYEGGKITDLELSNQVDGVLNIATGLDFAKETIGAGTGAYAAGTPTYSALSTLFVFNGASVTIGGTAFNVSDLSIKLDNKLKTDRYLTGGAGRKKEPLVEGLREISFDLTGEFDTLTQINRVASATAAGALAAIVATWTSAGGGTLTVTIPFGRFDEGPANFNGAQLIEHKLSGKGLEDGSVSALQVVYSTKDATP